MKARVLHFTAALALVTLGTACDSADKKTKSDAPAASSAKPKSKLEQEIAAAGASSAGPSAPDQGKGPPATGVFAAGLGDVEQPSGAPPKLTMVSVGSEPKLVLSSKGLAAGTRLAVSVNATAFQGPLPAMLYTLEVAGDDAPAKPDAKAAPDAGRTLVLNVKKAEIDPKWPGKLQEGAGKLLARLTGSKLTATLTPEGSLAELKVVASKDAKEIEYILEALAQSLGFVFLPVPKESVGTGASWLVADRTRIHGMELIRYRAATVQKLQGDDLVIGVDVRHYAPSAAALPEGLPAGVETLRLESFGQATFARKASDSTPLVAKFGWPIDIVIGKGGQRAGKLHAEVQVELQPAVSNASTK